MKVVQTAVLDSPLFSSLTTTHNYRLIVAGIWTDTKSALFQFVESQTLLPYKARSSCVEPLALSTLSLHKSA